jgi:hypothetical protein
MSEEIKFTPEQVEAEMLEREALLQKNLGVYAEFFQLYIVRFNNQALAMDKKGLLRLIDSLVGSEFNDSKDISKLLGYAKNLNVKSLLRSVRNAFEEGLEREKVDIKQYSKSEEKFFTLFSSLLSNKYIRSIQSVDRDVPPKVIEEVVKHTHDLKEFNKREKVEKDAFSTGNMLMYTKSMMVNYTVIEYMQENELKLNEKGK